jgi:endoglucanase Acf2
VIAQTIVLDKAAAATCAGSEAVNAWAGVIEWGTATGRQDIADLGIFLYTQALGHTKYLRVI